MNGAAWQQYGALPWRRTDGLKILLITSRETKRWVIPKGWPIDGMTPAESAAQEVLEEAGVRGAASPETLGHYDYSKRMKDGTLRTCRVDIFALEVKQILERWPERRQRKRHWFSPEEAAALVSEPVLAEIIRGFGVDQSEQEPRAPTYLQAIWRLLAKLLRCGGLR
jgi:8-oxo-dGTP pyrophosphatase MutT (NUDIX family)